MKYVNSVLQHYWRRWSKEYVVNLREFHKSKNPQNQRIVTPGEVMLVHDEKTPRQSWKIGRTIETQTSADGGVRGVEVAVMNKKGRLYNLNRPVQRIYPSEIRLFGMIQMLRLMRKRTQTIDRDESLQQMQIY